MTKKKKKNKIKTIINLILFTLAIIISSYILSIGINFAPEKYKTIISLLGILSWIYLLNSFKPKIYGSNK
jgi:hypothetical protein